MAKFVVHKDVLETEDINYLSGTNQEITGGFEPGMVAHSAAVNAILHETSLFVVAFADNMSTSLNSQIDPTTSVDSLKGDISRYLSNVIKNTTVNNATNATIANEAKKTSKALTLTINGTSNSFDGSAAKSLSFYAPTSVGTNNYLLKSNGSGTPAWTNPNSVTVGTANKVSNNLTITLNNSQYSFNGSAAKSLSFYAPISAGVSGQFLMAAGQNNAPYWVNASAMSVNRASIADTATNATYATNAGSATNATNATHATSAGSATNATNATYLNASAPACTMNLNSFTDTKNITVHVGRTGSVTFERTFHGISDLEINERYLGHKLIVDSDIQIITNTIKVKIENKGDGIYSEKVTVSFDYEYNSSSFNPSANKDFSIQWVCSKITF